MIDMLNSLKKNMNKKSITAYIIFGAIILVFVFFGFKTTDDQQMGYAARVNNKLISISEYKVALDRVNYFSKMFGGGNSPDSDMRNRAEALNQIIQLELISQGASQEGLAVTNPEVVDRIMGDESFKKDGVFQRDMYEKLLSYEGLSAASYEERLKKSLLYQKTFKLFENLLLASDFEIQKSEALAKESINIEFIKLEHSEVEKLADLERAITENPKAALDKAASMGLKWKETGFFSMTSPSIPQIGASNELILKAYKSSKGEVVPRVFNVMSAKYMVRLKDKKVDSKSADDKESKNIAAMRSQSLFQKWIQGLAQQYTIERNPTIVKMASGD